PPCIKRRRSQTGSLSTRPASPLAHEIMRPVFPKSTSQCHNLSETEKPPDFSGDPAADSYFVPLTSYLVTSPPAAPAPSPPPSGPSPYRSPSSTHATGTRTVCLPPPASGRGGPRGRRPPGTPPGTSDSAHKPPRLASETVST